MQGAPSEFPPTVDIAVSFKQIPKTLEVDNDKIGVVKA